MRRNLYLICLLAITLVSRAQTDSLSKGTLIIIGGGDIPDTIFTLFAQSCGGKEQPIVVIPTATEDDEWIRSGNHLKKFSDRGFTNLSTIHTRNKNEADDPVFLEHIRKAKGIYFGGGDQQRLADAYAGTKLHQAMFDLLKRGGVIMGTSAGATIMGSLLIGGDHRKTPHIPQTFPAGLSFLQHTAIDQHVLVRNRQFDLIPVLEHNPGTFGIAIDESTAAIVSKNKISIAGKSYVMIYDPKDWKNQQETWGRVYIPFRMMKVGDQLDLQSRKITRSK